MSDYEKPPLGAKPTYVSASDRIKELATAIINYSDKVCIDCGLVHLWACEILAQIEIIKKSKGEWLT